MGAGSWRGGLGGVGGAGAPRVAEASSPAGPAAGWELGVPNSAPCTGDSVHTTGFREHSCWFLDVFPCGYAVDQEPCP